MSSLTQLKALEQLSLSPSSSPVCQNEKLSTCSQESQEQGQKMSSNSVHIKYCYPAKLLCAAKRAKSSILLLVSKQKIEIKSALTMSGIVLTSFLQFNCSRIFQKHFTIILYQKSKSQVPEKLKAQVNCIFEKQVAEIHC